MRETYLHIDDNLKKKFRSMATRKFQNFNQMKMRRKTSVEFGISKNKKHIDRSNGSGHVFLNINQKRIKNIRSTY